jgi:hypothetical protein
VAARLHLDEQTGRMDERCHWRKNPLAGKFEGSFGAALAISISSRVFPPRENFCERFATWGSRG